MSNETQNSNLDLISQLAKDPSTPIAESEKQAIRESEEVTESINFITLGKLGVQESIIKSWLNTDTLEVEKAIAAVENILKERTFLPSNNYFSIAELLNSNLVPTETFKNLAQTVKGFVDTAYTLVPSVDYKNYTAVIADPEMRDALNVHLTTATSPKELDTLLANIFAESEVNGVNLNKNSRRIVGEMRIEIAKHFDRRANLEATDKTNINALLAVLEV